MFWTSTKAATGLHLKPQYALEYDDDGEEENLLQACDDQKMKKQLENDRCKLIKKQRESARMGSLKVEEFAINKSCRIRDLDWMYGRYLCWDLNSRVSSITKLGLPLKKLGLFLESEAYYK